MRNMLLLSIVNGYREYKMFIRINVANSLAGLVFAVVLTLLYGLPGCPDRSDDLPECRLLRHALYGASETLGTVVVFPRQDRPEHYPQLPEICFDDPCVDRTMPVAQILIRRYIMLDLSELEAGWWEAMNRISNIYLLVVTTSFSVYYLPRPFWRSPSRTRCGARPVRLKVIIPLLLTGFVLVYLCRFLIIRILFTSEFLPMAKLFGWQMGSDLFKIGCYILTYVMIAKARTVVYVTDRNSVHYNLYRISLPANANERRDHRRHTSGYGCLFTSYGGGVSLFTKDRLCMTSFP